MKIMIDHQLLGLFGAILLLLLVATVVGVALKRKVTDDAARDTVANLNARIRSWWLMCAFFVVALLSGGIGSILLFGFLSFLALKEFIALTATSSGDRRTLFWCYFVITPLQYVLVGIQWYGLFSILIPVYAFLFIPTRSALEGDSERFLERTAKIQWGLMVCVYAVSHAPALLMLRIPGYEGQDAKLLLFLVLVVQMSDVLQ